MPDDDSDLNSSVRMAIKSAVPESAGGVGGALVGFAVGGPVGAAIGAVAGPATVALHEIARNALHQRARRAAEAIRIAAQLRDISEQELEQCIVIDEDRLALAVSILNSVADSPLSAKRAALSRVLSDSSAEEDVSAIDHYWALARALRELDRPQLAVLQTLAEFVESSDRGLAPEELSQRVGLAAPDLRFGVRSLELHGAITDVGQRVNSDPDDPVVWQITALGLECLAYFDSPIPDTVDSSIVGEE